MLMTVTMINEWQLYVFNKGDDDDDGSGGRRSAVETVRQQKEREGRGRPERGSCSDGTCGNSGKMESALAYYCVYPPHFVGIC